MIMLAIQQKLDNDLKQVILTSDIDPYSIPFLYKDTFIRRQKTLLLHWVFPMNDLHAIYSISIVILYYFLLKI